MLTTDDGKCIVTLFLGDSAEAGDTNGRTLRDTTYTLLDRCAKEEGLGGMVHGFGRSLYQGTISYLDGEAKLLEKDHYSHAHFRIQSQATVWLCIKKHS